MRCRWTSRRGLGNLRRISRSTMESPGPSAVFVILVVSHGKPIDQVDVWVVQYALVFRVSTNVILLMLSFVGLGVLFRQGESLDLDVG